MIDRLPVELLKLVTVHLRPHDLAMLEAASPRTMQPKIEDDCWGHDQYGADLIPHRYSRGRSSDWKALCREKALMSSPSAPGIIGPPFFTGNSHTAEAYLKAGRHEQAIAIAQPIPTDLYHALGSLQVIHKALVIQKRSREVVDVKLRFTVRNQFMRAAKAGDADGIGVGMAQGLLVPRTMMVDFINEEAPVLAVLARFVTARGAWASYPGAIAYAMKEGKSRAIAALVTAGAPKHASFDKSINYYFGRAVVLRNDLDELRALVESGAKPASCDTSECTGQGNYSQGLAPYTDVVKSPLMQRAVHRKKVPELPFFEYLYAQGASCTERGDAGMTALHFLAIEPSEDAADCAQFLLNHGVQVDAPTDHGCTPLMYAVGHASYGGEERVLPLVNFLLSKGASASIQVQIPREFTFSFFRDQVVNPLLLARKNRLPQCVEALETAQAAEPAGELGAARVGD